MLSSAVVQNAIDKLIIKRQDLDTVRLTFLEAMKDKNPDLSDKEKSIQVSFEQPDRDSIVNAPVTDNGDGTYTCFATVQIVFSFAE